VIACACMSAHVCEHVDVDVDIDADVYVYACVQLCVIDRHNDSICQFPCCYVLK